MLSLLDKLLPLAGKMIRVISLRSVIVWALTGLISISCLAMYEYRDDILKKLFEAPSAQVRTVPTIAISNSTKSHIRQFVDREDLVVGMTILSVDIRNNRRIPVYWYSDDATVQKQLDSLFTGRFGGLPLFTSDDGNNTAIVSAINAAFICSPYHENGAAVLYPGFEFRFPVVCNTSVPPYFGQFAGYIAMTLNRKPSEIELDFLKAETTNISNEIFFRDNK